MTSMHSLKESDATCEMDTFLVKLAVPELYVFEQLHKTHFSVPKAHLGLLQLKVAKSYHKELHLRFCDGADTCMCFSRMLFSVVYCLIYFKTCSQI